VGNRSLTELRRTLTPTGTLLLSGGGVSTGGRLVGPFTLALKAQVLARFIPHRLVTMTGEPPIKEHLAALRELIESGKVTPIIDRIYPLRQASEAVRYLEVEHARAKVVITI
jgi:NADPH:quinone reductase-like Zn-dependent oxidoreductase